MTGKKRNQPQFQYYEIPNEEDVLTVLGADGIIRHGMDNGSEPGCAAVILKNISHAVMSREGEESFWEYLYINPVRFLEERSMLEKRERNLYLEFIEFHSFFCTRGEHPLLTAEINLLMDQMRTQGYGYRQCIRGLVFTLLIEIAKINHAKEGGIKKASDNGTEPTQKVAKALDYIVEHYAEKIQVSDIAGAAFVSTNYLRKLFLEYCQMAPMQYLNYVRIRAACRMLKHTEDNIGEVSRKAGYENLATFINNFKRYTGKTPKQWKEIQ